MAQASLDALLSDLKKSPPAVNPPKPTTTPASATPMSVVAPPVKTQETPASAEKEAKTGPARGAAKKSEKDSKADPMRRAISRLCITVGSALSEFGQDIGTIE